MNEWMNGQSKVQQIKSVFSVHQSESSENRNLFLLFFWTAQKFVFVLCTSFRCCCLCSFTVYSHFLTLCFNTWFKFRVVYSLLVIVSFRRLFNWLFHKRMGLFIIEFASQIQCHRHIFHVVGYKHMWSEWALLNWTEQNINTSK